MKKIAVIIIGILVVGIIIYIGGKSYTKSHSPEAIATYEDQELKIEVFYCQPSKKEREIFGDLVPFGKVWRTGANEATEIELTQDIKMGDTRVPAGRYALLTIPGKDQWTIILNTELGMWGAFTYEQEKDFLRMEVPSKPTSETVEVFTIHFEQAEEGTGIFLLLDWDDTRVSIPIEKIA